MSRSILPRQFHFFLLILLLGALSGRLCAQTLLTEGGPIAPEQGVSVLVDEAGSLTFQQVLELPQERFTPISGVPNFGYSSNTYWLRIPIQYQSTQDARDWVLDIAYPPLDVAELFWQTEDGYKHLIGGDHMPFREREIKTNTHVFPLDIEPGESKVLYLRLQSASSLQAPISFYTERAFFTHATYTLIFNGMFYGIMVVMAVYNFFLYLSIRRRSYLYYILYIICIGSFFAAVKGHSFQFLWPGIPSWADVTPPFFIGGSVAFAALFTRQFLQTGRNAPRMDRTFSVLQWSSFSVMATALFASYKISILWAVAMAFCFTPVALTTAILLIKRLRAARFFLFAWSTFLTGVALHVMTALGLLPSNLFTSYIAQIGCTLEVVLLSLALADRINQVQREKEEYQATALNALEKSNQVKDQFLATISHELRTPMNGVDSALQLIKTTQLDPEQKDYLSIAAQSSGEMMMLVDNILGFSEVQSGRLKIENHDFDLKSMIDNLAVKYYDRCRTKKLKFQLDVSPNIPHQVHGDERELHKLLSYLLDNAVKFTQEGKVCLSVDTEKPPNKGQHFLVRFQVSDTGIGIAEEKRQDIFEAFRQGEETYNRRFGGLGIGLAMSKQLVELMDGRLSLQSAHQQGTTFHAVIPLTCVSEESVQPVLKVATETKSVQENRESKVLVVEDNLVNQKVIQGILKKLGFQTLTAENGEEALLRLRESQVDAILMDCQMPVMDGFEATRRIRKLDSPNAAVPIIAVTANVMSGDRDRCLEAGMDDYLKKPVKKELIRQKLHYWLWEHGPNSEGANRRSA